MPRKMSCGLKFIGIVIALDSAFMRTTFHSSEMKFQLFDHTNCATQFYDVIWQFACLSQDQWTSMERFTHQIDRCESVFAIS